MSKLIIILLFSTFLTSLAIVMEAPGYGCQFPKDENRETEVSGFRFFVSWLLKKSLNPKSVVRLNWVYRLILHETCSVGVFCIVSRFRMSAAESTIRNPEERFRYLFSFNYVIHYYFCVITKLFSFRFIFVISSPNAIF